MTGVSPERMGGDAEPTVSVILTTFNRRELVQRAMESVQAQVYRDWELLIIDDGSTDGTAQAVLPAVLDDPRLRYHAWKNQGLAPARNWGLAAARGTFATFLDSDDEYTPDHLGRRIGKFMLDPALDVVHGGYQIIGPEGSDMVPDMEDPTRLIPISQCIVGATLFGKTEVFRTVGGFRSVYGTDADLFQRLRARRFQIGEVTTPTYLYHRDVPDSMCDAVKAAHGSEPQALEETPEIEFSL